MVEGGVVDPPGRGLIGGEGESPLDEATVEAEGPHKIMDNHMGKY